MQALVQPHCHQQAVLGQDADARVMAAAGIEPTAVLAGCCGLAGSFGAEAGHEAVSRAVAELELLPALRATDETTTILADGFSCRTQVAFLDGRRARHLAEVLADRLDGLVAGERRRDGGRRGRGGARRGRRRGCRRRVPAGGSPGVPIRVVAAGNTSDSTAASAGSSTRNPRPLGSTAYADTVPCIACTSWRTTYRPMPVPEARRALTFER